MKTITFNDVPDILMELNRKVDLLLDDHSLIPREKQDVLMTIKELIAYLPGTVARQTIYGWVHNRKIPFEKFGGKLLYFRKSTIDTWLANGRQGV